MKTELKPEVVAVYEHCVSRRHNWLVVLRQAQHWIEEWIKNAEVNGPLPRTHQVLDMTHGISSAFDSALEATIISQKVTVR